MNPVCVGDSITVTVTHAQARALAAVENRWHLRVTHNGLTIVDESFAVENDARRRALEIANIAIIQSEGVVFTWR